MIFFFSECVKCLLAEVAICNDWLATVMEGSPKFLVGGIVGGCNIVEKGTGVLLKQPLYQRSTSGD